MPTLREFLVGWSSDAVGHFRDRACSGASESLASSSVASVALLFLVGGKLLLEGFDFIAGLGIGAWHSALRRLRSRGAPLP